MARFRLVTIRNGGAGLGLAGQRKGKAQQSRVEQRRSGARQGCEQQWHCQAKQAEAYMSSGEAGLGSA